MAPSASVLPPATHKEPGALEGHISTKVQTKQSAANLYKDPLKRVCSGDSGDEGGKTTMHLIFPDYGKDMLAKRQWIKMC
jgi:hypothetical protein